MSPAPSDETLADLILERLDTLLDTLDRQIGAQLVAILHHPSFRALERRWRALKWLVDRVDFRENLKVAILTCSLEDLERDLSDRPLTDSGLFEWIYRAELSRPAGSPYGAVLADLEFGPEHAPLLERAARLFGVAQAPFIAAAAPALFDGRTLEALRRRADACMLGLTVQWFRVRSSYSIVSDTLHYDESVEPGRASLAAPAVYLIGACIADSFARYRWCPNIVGPSGGGLVPNAELVDPLAPERLAALDELGCITLAPRENAAGERGACVVAAPSLRAPRSFPATEEGAAAALNFDLASRLPYQFMATRIAHYLFAMYFTRDPAWDPGTTEQELNDWIGQYVADRDVTSSAVRSRRPLRKAEVRLVDSAHEDEWLLLEAWLRPHMKANGAFFTLKIDGKLERDG
ncbi:MAG: type VI secretion system contractile sheath large subunit [Polyangiaceae bacterium]